MTSKLADFEVRAELGEGGSAIVYDAEIDGHRVALKVLREELALSEREKQRFVDEARRMVLVDHPGLVKLERAGVLPDGRPFLAMPFLDGRTLSQRLGEGPLALVDAVRIFGVLARAVDALHHAGIVHRDIKPENILLVDEPGGARPVLLDFGIARDVDAETSTTTAAGKIRGTPAYMAPERFFGTPASPRSDIYELGVTFYMMLVGRLPWGTVENVSERLAPRGPDAFEPAIGVALARATLKALSTRPEARPETALDFAEEIEQAFDRRDSLAERTTEAFAPMGSVPPRALSEAPRPPARRSRLLLAVPLLGVTGAVMFGVLRSSTDSATPRSASSGSERTSSEPLPLPSAPVAAAIPARASSEVPWVDPVATSSSASSRPLRSRGSRPASAASANALAHPVKTTPASDPFLEDRR